MKRKNKIIVSFTLGAILATSGLAHSFHDQKEIKMEKKHSKGSPIIHMIMKLDLTENQREKMDTILKVLRNSMEHPTRAFSNSSFDREIFIDILEKRESSQIENEAKAIEKIYDLLDNTQKKHLKTILDMDEIKNLHRGQR